jgi:peptidoglycan-associated lipoprotein
MTILRKISLLCVVLSLAGAVGCGGKKTKEDESSVPSAIDADANVGGDSDSGKAMGLQTIYFPYDSHSLESSAKDTLKSNAEILKGKSSLKIQVEGHCDQRGGIQYNIALGEKRANAVKKYLQDVGVKADRITTVSFGKERPIDNRETEDAYGKNRRANFVVTSK